MADRQAMTPPLPTALFTHPETVARVHASRAAHLERTARIPAPPELDPPVVPELPDPPPLPAAALLAAKAPAATRVRALDARDHRAQRMACQMWGALAVLLGAVGGWALGAQETPLLGLGAIVAALVVIAVQRGVHTGPRGRRRA